MKSEDFPEKVKIKNGFSHAPQSQFFLALGKVIIKNKTSKSLYFSFYPDVLEIDLKVFSKMKIC